MTGRLWRCNLGRHRARGTGVRDYSFPVLQLITPLQADAALSARCGLRLSARFGPLGLAFGILGFRVDARARYLDFAEARCVMPGPSGGFRFPVANT